MIDNKKVLIIDDDDGIRDTYISILVPEEESDVLSAGTLLFNTDDKGSQISQKVQYDVCQAEDGFAGVKKVKEATKNGTPFAVAFIDMKMPGLNGAQTSQKIWEIDPKIKIVIVTAYSEYSPEEIISVTGRDDLFYLRKPFNHEEILQFARALTNEWNLERKRDKLESDLKKANKSLEDMNKNLEEKVKKQAAMVVQTEKMATVGLLASGVAHEINNPNSFIHANLSILKTYTRPMIGLFEKYEQAEQFLRSLASDEADRILQDIRAFKKKGKIELIFKDIEDLVDESLEGVDRVKNIVRDLNTFSRIDEAQFTKTDINKAIETTLNMVKTKFKYNVLIEKKLGDIPEIKCYPQKISQVFMNLLVNAAQAIEDKGTVSILTQLKEQGRRETDRFVSIVISDTGCGIPKENIGKLFDPFFTTKPVGKGTGLGLSIVYEIISAHNGTIQVDSRPGEGTRFEILLPVC